MDKYIIMHILMSKQYKKCFEQQTKNETRVDKNNKITKINSSEKTVKDNTNFLKNIDEDTILLLLSI